MRLEARLRQCNPNTPNSFSERILGGAQAASSGIRARAGLRMCALYAMRAPLNPSCFTGFLGYSFTWFKFS